MRRARVAVLHAPARVRGAVLLLHGGPVNSPLPDTRLGPAYLRMLPFGPPLIQRSHGHLAVAALRYRQQGWNSPDEPCVTDAREALDRIARRYPGRPVAVVGHSMGGRVALRVADHPAVRAVVGISAWLPEEDALPDLGDRALLLVHGTNDLITPWRRSEEVAEQLRAAGTDARFSPYRGRGHNLLLTGAPAREVASFVVEALGV